MDGLPSSPGEKRRLLNRQSRRQWLLRMASRPWEFSRNPLKWLKRSVIYLLFHRVDYRKLAIQMDQEAKQWPLDSSGLVCVTVFDAKKRIFQRDWEEESILLPFEGSMLPGPANYDAVLRSMYGDYLTPPPQAEKKPLHNYTAYWK